MAFAEASAQALAQALAQWRFQPRPEVSAPRAVYTVATMLFGAGTTTAELRRHCTIPDLAARLRELRADRTLRRQSAILDKLDLSTPANSYLREQ